MERTEWQKVSECFGKALELPSDQRTSWVKRELAHAPALLQEVLSLLNSHGSASDFLEDSLTQCADEILLSETTPSLRKAEEIGDFKILEKIGQGSFASVYRATQLTLGREVALKVSPDWGDEARHMAPLEHDHIVRVFLQTRFPEKRLRLLCMQLIPGTSLDGIIRGISATGATGGKAWLHILDRAHSGSALVDIKSLGLRQELEALDAYQSVYWLGQHLADALSHAHQRGVLHLDVKPQNILINPFGRAFLTDFNVALPASQTKQLVGGTLRYMSPEQRRWFDQKGGNVLVDARSDIYSLGLVLRELYLANVPEQTRLSDPDRVSEMEAILNRATNPNPELRFGSAADFAEVLGGALQRSYVLKSLPPPGFLHRMEIRTPLLSLAVLTLFPQVLGSSINISYNALRIVSHLTPKQQEVFQVIVVIFNAIVYPTCFSLCMRYAMKPLGKMRRPEWSLLPGELTRMRQQSLSTPSVIAVFVTIGWLACAVVFPTMLHIFSGPLAPNVALHFCISFALSWLIAVTYSFLLTQSMALRVVYPALCVGTKQPRVVARHELGSTPARMKAFHYVSGLLPLLVAMVLVAWGPLFFQDTGTTAFRFLISSLLSIAGFGFVLSVSGARELEATYYALTGAEKARAPGSLPQVFKTSTVVP